jgi:hypothetical protein
MIDGLTKTFAILSAAFGPAAAIIILIIILLPWILSGYFAQDAARERKLTRKDRQEVMTLLTQMAASLETMAKNQSAMAENQRALPEIRAEIARISGRMDGRR